LELKLNLLWLLFFVDGPLSRAGIRNNVVIRLLTRKSVYGSRTVRTELYILVFAWIAKGLFCLLEAASRDFVFLVRCSIWIVEVGSDDCGNSNQLVRVKGVPKGLNVLRTLIRQVVVLEAGFVFLKQIIYQFA
jgi:hypothetical protein